ncbi:hypothetical protein Z946_2966 [Sulfitobacter noctilucicola]|uniref:Excisionase family DNA binding protein n=1 Tax=Sulfitobacter noctilucicola TaxID=1342301 RepID=A0A7W6Q569_9RHOB|nr:hypothetical protein [Sulfitobacter noctilucicola]KIN64079.1 hypothetical protein Z946_2966 [Sulfitobacter noctilucicola]MBB4175433.1 excisionase family DNA binding protein [Sulfitobacter noctilucicola]
MRNDPSASATGLHFLSVEEAADKLGVSRIKVREAAERGLIPSKRDNENRLRLDLSDVNPKVLDKKGKRLTQARLMHVLFDEIEELHDVASAKAAEVEALRGIADRQADALDAAARRMDQDAFDKAQLSQMLDRALAHLEAGGEDTARLADVSGRALSALEATGAHLEDSLSQTARFDALVARALDYADAGKDADAKGTEAMAATAQRAMNLLDASLAEAEESRHAVVRTGQMLDRALETGARMEERIAQRDREIEDKSATVTKVLEMSERAVALATPPDTMPKKRSFWQWLMGK